MQTVPVIPESSPFNPSQRLWLNGYLAGLLAGSAPASDRVDSSVAPPALPLLILFGSQTGTAEGLARRIAKNAATLGYQARVVDAAAHATVDWNKETNLLIVTSTYGDGDMPDNAQAFWNWLQTDAATALAHLNFSVLALGDTNYDQFCAAGRKIDERLKELGAARIHPRADCNVDYETEARTWTEGVLERARHPIPRQSSIEGSVASKRDRALHQANGAANRNGNLSESPGPANSPGQNGHDENALTSSPAFDRNHPFPARLVTNRKLSGEGSGKETRHFELSLEDSGLTYEAGDALGVCPANCPGLVDDLLRALGRDGNEPVPAPTGEEVPFRLALGTRFDITRPTPDLLKRVARHNTALRDLLASERRDDLTKWLHGREVIDLLLETPEARFTPAEFVELLKKLAPRLYSISSSPRAHAGQVHLTINIVRYESHGRARKGVASTFLADRAGEQTSVPVFIQPSRGFRLPADGDTPIIMVGPGTGVAPFRAFLHARRAAGAKGRNWLLFGEQRAALDFYYRDELEGMLVDGHLTKLDTAFSRDQAEKIYVQRRMAERAVDLWAWLEEGAHFYVCGDASRMAKDVDAALHQVVETVGGRTWESAAEYIQQMKADKRYQRDVY